MKCQDPIITVQDLTIGYEGEPLLRNLRFEVQRGEVFAILGPSGCGKSTVFKHLVGLMAPLSGSICIDGDDIAAATAEERLAILRNIGVAYQSGALFASMTLSQNVRLPLEEHTCLPSELMDQVVWMHLKQVGLEDYGDYLPNEISGGMQKRAALARALALDPKVVFLDEPSAGLDPITSAELDALIFHLNQTLKMTFVLVTHELSSIYSIANRVILLDRDLQGILAEGAPTELRDHSTQPQVKRFFCPQGALKDKDNVITSTQPES